MRYCLTPALIAVALSVPLPALAQECPPGSWFCEETEVVPPPEVAPAPPPPVVVQVPVPPVAPVPPVVVVPSVPPRAAPPPPRVVVVQSDATRQAPQIVIITPGARPLPPPPPVRVVRRVVTVPARAKPTPIRKRWKSELGLNLRLQGIALGKSEGEGEEARMGGLGLSLRYRPWRAFALDAGVDVIGGVDYNGDKRMELPLSLNGLLYVNPRSRVQFYFIGGIHWSHAKVDVRNQLAEDEFIHSEDDNGIEYTYFGGQLGAGLDFRLWRHVSLFIDGVGFMRERTDDNPRPEFTDPDTGRTTNASGGGIFRGGLTIWW